ncbi:MAG: ABC transporter ATP-binding protein [Chloroflexi bacterium]|nr:ABC transporter ATP-binding protein [Chloroflexota bacterium]
MQAIEINGLRKLYGTKVALEGLTLQVAQGEIFGFLGPNGAGKTTTLKILVGLIAPSAGEALIFGRSPRERAVRRRIGFLPEHFRFQDWLSGSELLSYYGHLCGMGAAQRQARIPTVLALVGLDGHGDKRVRAYSKGMQQRLGIAQALLSQPDLILLDEPTSALDPLGRKEVRDLLRRLRDEGVTVFLNSHLLGEIELVCDRVAIIDKGRVVREGPLKRLLQGEHELRITLDRIDGEVLAALAAFGEVRQVDGRTLALQVPDVGAAPRVARCLMEKGYDIYGLTPLHQSLEEIFAQAIKGGDGWSS